MDHYKVTLKGDDVPVCMSVSQGIGVHVLNWIACIHLTGSSSQLKLTLRFRQFIPKNYHLILNSDGLIYLICLNSV